MTITRLASAGRKHVARIAAASVALASVTALAVAGVAERASVADSFTVLGHLHWLWIPAALLLEFASMAAFAIMLRRLLAAGGASVGIRPMLATAYAANAVSVSVPLAGPPGHGLHVPPLHPAGRGCPAGRLVAAGRRGDLLGRGGPYRGRRRAGVGEHPGHGGHRARRRARRSRPRRGGRGHAPPAAARRARAASGMDARQGSRMLRRPAADPGRTIRAWAQRLGSLQLPPSGWITATGLALANWLADAAVLAVSIRAAGATVTASPASGWSHWPDGWSCSGCGVPRPAAVPVLRGAPPTNRTPPWPLT